MRRFIIFTTVLYFSSNSIRVIKAGRMRLAGHAASMREKRNAARVLVGEPGGKRQLGRIRRRWRIILKQNSMR
jgi:hypothetical protein